jgi:hypothetical protein
MTPTPVTVYQECDLCGMDWAEHGENPTTDDCIALLKMALVLKSPVCLRPHYPVPVYTPSPWWQSMINTPWYVSSQSWGNGNSSGLSFNG